MEEKKIKSEPMKYAKPWDSTKKHNPSPSDRFKMMLDGFKGIKPQKPKFK